MENGPSFMIRSTPRDPTLTRAAYPAPHPARPGVPACTPRAKSPARRRVAGVRARGRERGVYVNSK